MVGAATMRDPQLDLLRSVAITHVILFHVLYGIMRFSDEPDMARIVADFPAWMNFAWQPLGVDVIFVVSAYLLTRSLLVEKQRTGAIAVKSYFVRRVSRIIPLYYIAVVLFALAEGKGWEDTLLAFAFLLSLTTDRDLVPVGWSMELMMLVYVLLPLIVWGIFQLRRPLLWLTIALVISVAVRFGPLLADPSLAPIFYTHLLKEGDPLPVIKDLYFQPWFRMSPFIIGIALAAFEVFRPAQLQDLSATAVRRTALYGTAAALFAFALFLPVHDENAWIYRIAGQVFWTLYWPTNAALVAVATALIIIAGHGRPIRIPGPWAMISRNIMGIYLFHMPLILIGAVIVFGSTDADVLGTATVWHVLGIFVIALILSLGVAALLNRFIEAPTQRVLRRKFAV